MRTQIFNLMVTVALLMIGTGRVSAAEQLERYEFLQIQMGVPFRITLYAGNDAAANKAARAAYARIKQLNGVLSDYDPDSELMRLCRSSGPRKPVKVGRDLERVVSASLKLSAKTGGAFDVTIGPVVRLWRIARRKKQMPAPMALADALDRVGHRHVRLDTKQHTIELRHEGMRLDLGGIAKGFAGDEALKVLKAHGVTRALIDGSGDIVAGDPPPGKTGWIIEVAAVTRKPTGRVPKPTVGIPSEPQTAKPLRLILSNAAVATSGDAYQNVKIDGKRYSHIINPKTGLGLTRSSSVTVIAENGMAADSLASAVSVLGPERGLKLIGTRKTRAAMVVILHDGQPRKHATKSLARFITTD
jgi:thiamine biosynthesis lipoprotein